MSDVAVQHRHQDGSSEQPANPRCDRTAINGYRAETMCSARRAQPWIGVEEKARKGTCVDVVTLLDVPHARCASVEAGLSSVARWVVFSRNPAAM